MYRELQKANSNWVNYYGSRATLPEFAVSLPHLMKHIGTEGRINKVITRNNIDMFDMNGRNILPASSIPKLGNDVQSGQPVTEQYLSNIWVKDDNFVSTLGEQNMNMLLRGQVENNTQKDRRWETNYNNNTDFFNYARFPCVIHWQEGKVGRVNPVGYIVAYSSFEPTAGPDGNHAILPHKPNWVDVTLSPDDRGNTKTQNTIKVDNTLIGDTNCMKSLIASLQNTFPMDGAYVYMWPDVGDDVRNANTIFHHTHRHKVSGASCGMAMFAAVSGWSAAYYTGFIRYIIPGYEYERNSGYKNAMVQANLRERSGNSVLQHAAVQKMGNYDVVGSSVVPVVKQLNFVETIQDLAFKVTFAISIGAPLIFPAFNEMNMSTESALNHASNQATMRQWLSVMPLVYTMSMSQDGIPVKWTNGNNTFTYSLFSGNTVTEFSQLQMLATVSAISGKLADAENDQVLGGYKTSWRENVIKTGVARAAEQAPRLAEMKQIRKTYKETKNAPQYYKAIANVRHQTETKKKAKVATKKASNSARSLKISEVKKALKNAADTYKQNYDSAKVSQNYIGMTKKEKKEFNNQWKTPASAKRQMMKDSIMQFIKNGGITLATPRDPENLRNGLRNSAATKLINQHGMSPEQAKAMVETLYGAPKGPRPIPVFGQSGNNQYAPPSMPQSQGNNNGNDDDDNNNNMEVPDFDDDFEDDLANLPNFPQQGQNELTAQAAQATAAPSSSKKEPRPPQMSSANKNLFVAGGKAVNTKKGPGHSGGKSKFSLSSTGKFTPTTNSGGMFKGASRIGGDLLRALF